MGPIVSMGTTNTVYPKILFITSDAYYQKEFPVVFRKNKFDLLLAPNPFQALQLLERNSVEVVLLGPRIEPMNYPEVIALIRSRHSKEELPIIQIFSEKIEEEIRAVQELGCNTHLVNPTPLDLIKGIQAHLKTLVDDQS